MDSRVAPLSSIAGMVVVAGALVGLSFAGPVAASSPHSSTTTLATTTTTTTGTTTTTPTSTTTTVPPTTTTTTPPRTVDWPRAESAAAIAPDLSVAAASPNQPRVAIASLTKMMTAWVVLHRLPLTFAERGPCHVVTAADVALYRHDVETGQSSAAVSLGVRLCEGILMRGLLVHSAGNYAEMLVHLSGLTDRQFVAVMNRTAAQLGLRATHYVDVTGIGAGNRSTAEDQVRLAALLVTNEPIVARIVTLPSVHLPVAGVVGSYTPFVGQGGVVGVKSGYTDQAGGCDVMAVEFHIGKMTTTVFAAVLGDHGPNSIVGAGQIALSVARQIRLGIAVVGHSPDAHFVWRGDAAYVVTTTTTTTTTTTSSTTTTTLPASTSTSIP